MNCKKPTQVPSMKNLNENEVLMLKLKIQRLQDDDFFVSISGKGLITHLKEKIVTFLKAAEVVEENPVGLRVTSLRLIYKGKVLLDAKSIEFYKIQNDDTIQLCPLLRKKQRQQNSVAPISVSSGNQETTDSKEEAPGHRTGGRDANQFTLISFSVNDNPIDLLGRNEQIRSRGRGVDTRENIDTRGQPRRGMVRTQRRPNFLSRERPSPATISGTLRNFKQSLEETLRRVSNTSLDNRRQLVPQLDALITEANSLRNELHREEPIPLVFQSPLYEIMLLERMGAGSRPNDNARAPVRWEEEKRDTTQIQLPSSTSSSELIPFRNEPIDIRAELLNSPIRYPLRVNTGAASEFPPIVAAQSTPHAILGTTITTENNAIERPITLPRDSNSEDEREPQPQRRNRRNIFSNLINRFSRC